MATSPDLGELGAHGGDGGRLLAVAAKVVRAAGKRQPRLPLPAGAVPAHPVEATRPVPGNGTNGGQPRSSSASLRRWRCVAERGSNRPAKPIDPRADGVGRNARDLLPFRSTGRPAAMNDEPVESRPVARLFRLCGPAHVAGLVATVRVGKPIDGVGGGRLWPHVLQEGREGPPPRPVDRCPAPAGVAVAIVGRRIAPPPHGLPGAIFERKAGRQAPAARANEYQLNRLVATGCV